MRRSIVTALALFVASSLAAAFLPTGTTLAASAVSGNAVAPWAPLELPGRLQSLLSNGDWDATPKGFRIVALSVLADACVFASEADPARRSAALACVDRCLELARRLRPLAAVPRGDGLWLSHFNLLLGARDRLGACADAAEHEALSRQLAQDSLAEPTRHHRSYAGQRFRWPADQTATLASLARFDRAHGASVGTEPARQWRGWLLRHAFDARRGLPWSEASGRAKGARLPRGCALSWQTRYLQEFAPDLARTWWKAYRRQYLVEQVGLSGFREWPPGSELPADVDSGPIVLGVGAAATAFGLAAARMMGEEDLASRLERTAAVAETMTVADRGLKNAAGTVLATAIRYLGRVTRPAASRTD